MKAETKPDLAGRYKVSIRTVTKWMGAKRIPFLKIGRSVRFDPEAVDAALACRSFRPARP